MAKLACLDDYETLARQKMAGGEFGFYCTGAENEVTLRRNREAYDRLLIRPKVLIDVSKVNTSVTIQGHTLASPICVAPTSLHGMAHHEGEKATARACASLNTCYCISSYSNYSMEEAAAASASVDEDALRWFQLYVEQDRKLTEQLVRKCEKAGYKALVLTVDRPVLGRRLQEVRYITAIVLFQYNGLYSSRRYPVTECTCGQYIHRVRRSGFKLPKHLRFGNFEDREHDGYFGYDVDASLNWDDVAWLKNFTKLPIIIKGIMRADDAALAVRHGVAGIIVSNHGGRQLDTCPATIEALPEVVKACRNTNVDVYVDGGIRRGSDVFKALALGAKAVFLGRPIIYGLVHQGEEGVKQVLTRIQKDFEATMALSGKYFPPLLYFSFGLPLKPFFAP
ncbi:FMN-dependent dehydrogenase [Zychaea mexicana]|uniref:FMN-dependent dehydrogenase n=1 Tax=Zychaea mexicana TaxID=64656 RepID=UPI0022FDD718|nr:FMN-dependent dehydrogenase [Zychaea mexicana]KAI9495606.1 FMN-dependent dehydrogenase [Zychaea mexicana]